MTPSFKVGDLITNGSSAGKILARVERDKAWRTSGWRVQNIAVGSPCGGNTGMSSFVSDTIIAGWQIITDEWAPVVGAPSLEARYEWSPCFMYLIRAVRRVENA